MAYVTHGNLLSHGIVAIFSKNKGLTMRVMWASSRLHVGQVGLSGMCLIWANIWARYGSHMGYSTFLLLTCQNTSVEQCLPKSSFLRKNKAKQKRVMWAPCGLHVGQLGLYLKCDQYRLTVRRMWATQRFVF